jgi:hypothetical protein
MTTSRAVILHCDNPGCEETFMCDGTSVSTTHEEAAREGWGNPNLAQGVRDLCPRHRW